jgi:beta-galactosidase
VAAKLRLHVDCGSRDLIADGADFLRVHAEVCDARGTFCPLADDLVAFGVGGEGSIIAGPEIGANPVHAEAGIASILLRSTPRAERIVVTARAFGLAESRIEIASVLPENRRDEHPSAPRSIRSKETRHAAAVDQLVMPTESA